MHSKLRCAFEGIQHLYQVTLNIPKRYNSLFIKWKSKAWKGLNLFNWWGMDLSLIEALMLARQSKFSTNFVDV